MLKLTNVTKTYKDVKGEDVNALKDINLTFPDTGMVVITGTSGCGKTTLLNIIGGLDRPTSGEVSLDEVRIDNNDEEWWDAYRGASLGFVYQDFNLLENMTVRDNIWLPLNLRSMEEVVKQKVMDEIADELGLNEYMNKKAGKLSGGQKQRVAIARALVTGTKIILADEPTGNLDKENSENVFKILKKIAKKRLVIVVTHDSELASSYADRLIQISYGVIENDMSVDNDNNIDDNTSNEDIFSNENLLADADQRKLSLRECLTFASEAIKQRKRRCVVSVFIFSITLLLILVISEGVFRNDSIPVTKYITDKNQKILPLGIDVSEDYLSLVDEEQVTTGRKFYETISACADKSRIVQFGYSQFVEYGNDKSESSKVLFVNADNKQYFTYEGTFPEKESEIAISETLANKLGDKGTLGSSVVIKEKEYIITAIVTRMCEKDIKDISIYDGTENISLKNVVLFSEKALTDNNISHGLYMSGFGVTITPNLFHQVTVYNEIGAIDDETQLVAGRMPKSDNEILVSDSLYETKKSYGDDILNMSFALNNVWKDKYESTYWSNLNLYDYVGEKITVVGVVDGNKDYYVTNSLYEKMFDEYKNYYEYPYYLLVDDEMLQDDVRKLLKNDVKVIDQKLQKAYDFMWNIDSIKIALVIVCAVIAMLAVLQMISLYSYSISDSKKTIGILRTIGVNKSDTKKIFVVECLVVSVTAFVVAVITSVFVTMVLNSFINKDVIELDNFNILRMRAIIIMLIGSVNCIMSAISVLVPIRKYSKMKIIELIK